MYGTESVAGLQCNVKAVLWPREANTRDVVWILSSDVTGLQDTLEISDQERLVHLA
jgi:hypothetical protein